MIEYKLTITARLARTIIPLLYKLFPRPLYIITYNFLYNSYKVLLRKSYLLKVLSSTVLGNKREKIKTSLTNKLLPYTMGGRKALENAFDLVESIEDNLIEGAIVECGVAEGGTAAMMALSSLRISTLEERDKWFFDSYEGLPEPTEEDYIGDETGNFIRPLPKGSCLGTIEQVSDLMFNELKLDKSKVKLVKGWFQNTVPSHKDKIEKIAVLRLDGDWYESTKIPLENFFEKVSRGGFVIIDDYATCFGSKKATDEYLSENNLDYDLNSDGRGGAWFQKV